MRKYISLGLAVVLTAAGMACLAFDALYLRPDTHGDTSALSGKLVWMIGLGSGWLFALGLIWLLSDLEEWRRW